MKAVLIVFIVMISMLSAAEPKKDSWWMGSDFGIGKINSKNNIYSFRTEYSFADTNGIVFTFDYHWLGQAIAMGSNKYKSNGIGFQLGKIVYNMKPFIVYPAIGLELASMTEGIGELQPGYLGGDYEDYDTHQIFYVTGSVVGQYKFLYSRLELGYQRDYSYMFVQLGMRFGRFYMKEQ